MLLAKRPYKQKIDKKPKKANRLTQKKSFPPYTKTETFRKPFRTQQQHEENAKKKKMRIDASEASTMHFFAEQEENTECVLGVQKAKCSLRRKRNGCNNNNVIVASIIAIFVAMQHAVGASPSKDVQPLVKINKCCEKFEIYVDGRCTNAQEINSSKCLVSFFEFVLKIKT